MVFDTPGGAFYLMAALPVDDADRFQQWLLEEFDDNGETVMFAPGAPMYATPGKGRNEVRMAYVIECCENRFSERKKLIMDYSYARYAAERAAELLALGIKKYNETHGGGAI